MKVLITGKGGQLSTELQKCCPLNVNLLCLGINELDVTDGQAVDALISQKKPDLLINAAAYTAVDKAESDRDNAFLVNAEAVKVMAESCQKHEVRLIQVSTDFVFDGLKSSPYLVSDTPNPEGVYGESKALAERHVLDILPESGVVVRTAWLYSSTGQNFVKTMLRLMSEKPQLSVISDQVGTPTWAKGLAECIWAMSVKPELKGMYHWSDAGAASWYDFAVAIQDLGLEMGLLEREIPISPIPTSAYPTPAKRPAYSVLDKSKTFEDLELSPKHWRHQLKSMMLELK
jgi:dTDP-4-dehydrorhamnose reductase